MSYKLRYHINWLSIEDDVMRIEILKEGYSGEADELTPSANPLTVQFSSSDEFLYNPMRDSTCSIGVVDQDHLQELFATGYQQWKIVVYRNEVMVWCGFVKPEVYTQDYVSVDSEFEIQGVSSLGILDKIPFEVIGGYTPIKELLKRAIDAAKSEWKGVYIPAVYGEESTTSSSLFMNMQVNESLFKDATYYEFLKEIMKFFNWTAADWSGELIFIDVDNGGQYYYYDLSLNGGDLVNNKELSIQELGSRGSSHKIDRLGGYNKASVRAVNNNLSELFEQSNNDKLREIGQDGGRMWPNRHILVLLEDGDYECHHYDKDGNPISSQDWENMKPTELRYSMGGRNAQSFYYSEKEPPSNPQFRDVISCRALQVGADGKPSGSLKDIVFLRSTDKILTISRPESLALGKGAIVVNFNIQAYGMDYNPNNDIYNDLIPSEKGNQIKSITCSLRYGNMWWSGGRWVNTESKFDIELEDKDGANYTSIKSNKTLDVKPHGATGYLAFLYRYANIQDWKQPQFGDIEFTVYSSTEHMTSGSLIASGFNLSGLSVSFVPLDKGDLWNRYTGADSDRIYENVVNEDFINELDEIEFKLSSYNYDGASLSKPIMGDDNFEMYYSSIYGGKIRPEEHLIRRIRGQYMQPKTMITTQLKLDKIKPHYWFTNKFNPNTRFIAIEGNIDYRFNTMELKIIDNDR